MKKSLKQVYQRMIVSMAIMIGMIFSIPTYVNASQKTMDDDFVSRYITVYGKKAHVLLYGDVDLAENDFADKSKTVLVMLPGLASPSPHMEFKPLAQALDSEFNVVIIEPLGYGLSDLASTDRTAKNINQELNKMLDEMGINECLLLVHSFGGVYGMDFVRDYPEKVKGFIAIDNTVYDPDLIEELAAEKEYILQEIEQFNRTRDSFSSIQEFQNAIAQNPEKYQVELPQVTGYTYSERDKEEYIQAVSLGSNETIKNEVSLMDQSLEAIKGKKFPDSLPVLTMISSSNATMPAWVTGHRNQLNFESGSHELYTVEGSHYIWYTNMSGVVDHIKEWKSALDKEIESEENEN